MSEPIFENTPNPQSSGVDSIIPYKNGAALAAYYLSVFSLVPFLGLCLGIPAIILGVVGLKKSRKYPTAKGGAHAWVGIILGSLTSLVWIGLIVTFVVAAVMNAPRR